MLRHVFIESAPDIIEPGVIYVSIKYATALHLCVCGCGNEVVTPFGRSAWTLTFDGESISLSPSIGNWSFPCKSHYFIRRDGVVWANHYTPQMAAAARAADNPRSKPLNEAITKMPAPADRSIAGLLRKLREALWP